MTVQLSAVILVSSMYLMVLAVKSVNVSIISVKYIVNTMFNTFLVPRCSVQNNGTMIRLSNGCRTCTCKVY